MKKTIAVLFLCLLLLVSMIGCTQVKQEKGDTKAGNKKESNLPTKLEDSNILVLMGNPEPNQLMSNTTSVFEQKYGGKVSFIGVAFNQLQEKLMTMVSAGDSPDAAFYNQQHMPLYAIKNLVQPIDPYFDLNDSVLNLDVMNQFKWNGKYYGISDEVNAHYIYFNKTMFENNGLKTPLELFKEGKWNWETFMESTIALTQDTNADGNVDQWGFGTHLFQTFITANDTDAVEFLDDGSVKLTVSDPKTIEALQFIQDGLYNGYFRRKTNTHQTEFPIGKLGMTIGKKMKDPENAFIKDMKDEWGMVPFPLGPSNEKGVYPAAAPFWGIPTNAQNPKGGATWIYLMLKQNQESMKDSLLQVHTEEQIRLIMESEQKARIPKYPGIGTMNKLVNEQLVSGVMKGTPVLNVIDTMMPKFQAEIDLTINN